MQIARGESRLKPRCERREFNIIRSKGGTSLIRVSMRNDITKVLSAILRVDRQEQRGIQESNLNKNPHEYKKRTHHVPLAASCFTKGVSCISEVMATLLRPL